MISRIKYRVISTIVSLVLMGFIEIFLAYKEAPEWFYHGIGIIFFCLCTIEERLIWREYKEEKEEEG